MAAEARRTTHAALQLIPLMAAEARRHMDPDVHAGAAINSCAQAPTNHVDMLFTSTSIDIAFEYMMMHVNNQ